MRTFVLAFGLVVGVSLSACASTPEASSDPCGPGGCKNDTKRSGSSNTTSPSTSTDPTQQTCGQGQVLNSSGTCSCANGQLPNTYGQCTGTATQCPVGQGINASGSCGPCPTGQYPNQYGQCATNPCPTGQYPNTYQNGQCTMNPCQNGMYPNQSGQCVGGVGGCQAGQMMNQYGQCVQCQYGQQCTGSGNGGGDPVVACNQFVTAMVDAYNRCGMSDGANSARITGIAICSKVIALRDPNALYNICIPFYQQQVQCQQMLNPVLYQPPACTNVFVSQQ